MREIVRDLPKLREIRIQKEKVKDWEEYPFSIPVIKNLNEIQFKSKICFFVGENGSGKSTLLEGIAENYGLGREGGSRNISFQTSNEVSSTKLSEVLRLRWSQKILNGYFLRAESFFNVANYLDELAKEPWIGKTAYDGYGGKSPHKRSHGEAFFTLFQERLSEGGFLLLDEPEAALSPQRQLSFLIVLHDILKNENTQIIIASHSPIILAFPGAQILSFDSGQIEEITYENTKPYQIVKNFVQNPKAYFNRLFDEATDITKTPT